MKKILVGLWCTLCLVAVQPAQAQETIIKIRRPVLMPQGDPRYLEEGWRCGGVFRKPFAGLSLGAVYWQYLHPEVRFSSFERGKRISGTLAFTLVPQKQIYTLAAGIEYNFRPGTSGMYNSWRHLAPTLEVIEQYATFSSRYFLKPSLTVKAGWLRLNAGYALSLSSAGTPRDGDILLRSGMHVSAAVYLLGL